MLGTGSLISWLNRGSLHVDLFKFFDFFRRSLQRGFEFLDSFGELPKIAAAAGCQRRRFLP